MTQWTIIVEFETHDGQEEAFTTLIKDHARRTLQEEAGCKRFEVIKPTGRDGKPVANKVMVNELYADEAAVATHEANPRMPSLQAATGPLLKSRRLIYCTEIGSENEEVGLAPDQLNAANDD